MCKRLQKWMWQRNIFTKDEFRRENTKIVVHPRLESKNYNENVNKEIFLEKESLILLV